jgi:2-succinyl-5-enolpyruvyl-6-hydroxy-3-cyclohexene-1-carboxylate synthase
MDQSLFDTSEICYQQGVRHAVFSPGSRNAPLSISFNRNQKIETKVILDERSAGFIALGIAQQTGRPVVLCCTSGTSLLNYGPAIAEAYFQKIPLVVLSADRPPEWIDQWDGQTIRQDNPFQNHMCSYVQLPVDRTHEDAQWEYRRKIAASILTAQKQKGPVHINVPIREPFYPNPLEDWEFDPVQNMVAHQPEHKVLLEADWVKSWESYQRKLIVLGQGMIDASTRELLEFLIQNQNIPVINEITGNGHHIEGVILHQDLFLGDSQIWNDCQPDLILTLGLSTLSKNLKMLLRQSNATHWHVTEMSTLPGDSFKKLSTILETKPNQLLGALKEAQPQPTDLLSNWRKSQRKAEIALDQLETAPYSEIAIFQKVLKRLPDDVVLHLSNSMPVRLANMLGGIKKQSLVYCNRGTSGIDGSNSTAVGHAMSTEKQVVLLSGDLSFLYDRNAFLHEYDLSNLRVIVFNNFGGGIFELIPGPAQLHENEKEKHFTTPHHKDLKHSALDAGMLYFKANDEVTLELALQDFFERSNLPKLLEIQTANKINIEVYQKIKRSIT